MDKGVLTNKKHFITTFLCVAAVLVGILFFSSGLTVHAFFSGHSSGETREELHQDTIAVTVNEDAPAITFLTHGLGGSAGHWSNSMHRNAYNEWVGSSDFSYDPDSIIEKIRNQIPSGIKLYKAEMNNLYNPYSFSTNNFTLYKYSLNNVNNPTAYTSVQETIVNDFSQHVVVVFDLQNNYDETNAQVYEELHYIIDQISYDYFVVMGDAPKINLIGHSRGGLINMDYAIDHPKNVGSLISLGTPYNGSWYDNWFVELLGINTFGSIGGADIVSTTLINTRKNNWNSVYNQNTHINFHAISGTTAKNLMNHIVWDHNHLEEAHLGTAAIIGIRAVYDIPPMSIEGGLSTFPGDICVDKPSQEASGYDGVNRFNKEFTESNSNCNKRSEDTFPVPHNLETYDSDIHNYIFNNSTFGEPFDTTNIGFSEIRIDNANFTVRGIFSIPDTIDGKAVVAIGNSAFSNQNQLYQITIPASITNIGSNAFENCTSLTNVSLPNNLTSIGNSAFKGCTSLSSITMPNSVTSMDSSSFENCTSLTNVTFPNSLTTIESSAFKGCSSLNSITIPNSVTSLGSNVFYGCSSLTDITIPFVGKSRTATGNDAKFGYIFGTIPFQLKTVSITSGTNIPQDAFYNCSNLTSITIPDSVTSIGSNAFNGCTNLSSLTIPNSVTSLGSDVLRGCSGLTSIKIPFVGQSRTAIDHYAKFGYLFGSTPYDEGDIIDQNGIAYYIPRYLETVEITSVTNIPEDAFYNYSWLTSIILPDTVTNIGSNAFYSCYSLTSTTIPNALTSIGSNAFYYCLSLTSLIIPDSVTSLGSNVFYRCSSFTSITIPFVGQSRTATGDDAKFAYIFGTIPNQLRTVVITGGTNIPQTNIPQDAFYGCSYLTSITIPNTITSIGSNAFYGCYNLTTFTTPSSVTSIGSNAFYGCHNLTSFTIPSSVTSLGSNVFYGCAHLSSLLYDVVVTASGYYNIQIENISSVTVKIDGETNYFPNDIQQKYLTDGNHTIQAESANIATMVSFPIIAVTEYIPYYIDIDNIYIVFYDGPEMQYATYLVTSTFSQANNFDLINRSITFTSITCEWDLENLNYQEFHLVQMFIGENYYYENGGIYFECYDGYQSSYNTWSYSATAYNITITFSHSEWDQNVHQL